ncbi:hypothetical protein AB0M79_33940 [Polymorphospora sp. NPDC051019]|uniref:hypothetical protein n=1 Tax=Polymorphospora sp. NPDC051019 TaxID=3155725 RepID=UPI00342EE958
MGESEIYMGQANDLLRNARLNRPSTSGSGRAMSRQELAEAVNARMFAVTGRVGGLDGNYVGKLERGEYRWPGADYRAAFRAVLGAASDADLGFYVNRRAPGRLPAAVRPPVPVDDPSNGTADPDRDRTALRLVVVPGTAITVAVGPLQLRIEATSERSGVAERAAVVAAGAGVYTLQRRAG